MKLDRKDNKNLAGQHGCGHRVASMYSMLAPLESRALVATAKKLTRITTN